MEETKEETGKPEGAQTGGEQPAEAPPKGEGEAKTDAAALQEQGAEGSEAETAPPAETAETAAIKALTVDEVPADVVTLRQMLEAGVHFGHQTHRWNPKMRRYIYGARNGVHILDLQQTLPLFLEAYRSIMEAVANGGTVLFVGTKKQAQDVVEEEAARCGMFYVTHRWLGGTLTNFRTIKGSIDRLRSIEKAFEDGTMEKLSKKEALGKAREKAKLEKNLGGIREMNKLPAVVFVVDPIKERIAVAEARKLGIPVVAIADSNCDPDILDYIIPGNDDAIRAIRLFSSRIADACLQGSRIGRQRAVSRAIREEEAAVEVVSRRTRSVRPDPEAVATPDE
jgi:small subunit ribosomal protein S2